MFTIIHKGYFFNTIGVLSCFQSEKCIVKFFFICYYIVDDISRVFENRF